MQQTRDIHDTVFEYGSAVLMARIVDGAGVSIVRAQVAAIVYSIYELDPREPGQLEVVAGHDCVALDADDVFLDALEVDGLWNLDVAGYNFRHEIRASPDESFPRAGACYEIRYVLVPKFGAATVVRFYVRVFSQ